MTVKGRPPGAVVEVAVEPLAIDEGLIVDEPLKRSGEEVAKAPPTKQTTKNLIR
jgi:hypothetical protein